MKDVYNKEKAAVNQLLGKTKAKQSELEDALKGVVEMKTRVQRAGERVAQQINTSVDTLIEKLSDRRDNLLQQAGEIKQGKLKGLQVQQEELELALSTVTSSVEFTEKALRDGSQVEVLSMNKQMTDRLRELNMGTRPLNPCSDDVIFYEVKTGNFDGFLNGLGRVSDARTAPKNCVIKTNIGMKEMKIRKETKLSIIAKDQHGRARESGGDDVSVDIKSPSVRDGIERVNVTDNNDGTYRASYTPRVPGIHRVFVKINGAHIQGSPFSWSVKSDRSARMSTLQMEDKSDGVVYNTLVNQPRDFTIITRDNNGEQSVEEGDEISVQIKDPNTRTLEVIPVQDRGDGRYTFNYRPNSTGNYQMTVKVNGNDIQGSPFTWAVEQWHLVGSYWGRPSEDLRFSQDDMTVSRTGGIAFCEIVGSCGFSAGCHSWKVKVVSERISVVGVIDCNVSAAPWKNSWYGCGGSKFHVRIGEYPGTAQPSNITGFTEDDICIVFLNHYNKQLTVHHLPSGKTDTWGDVSGQNRELYPYFMIDNGSTITLLL